MTLEDIKALVTSVDPTAGHYESAYHGGQAYTVWKEDNSLGFTADGRHQGAISFHIDRFTKDEFDLVAPTLFDALEADDRVAFTYLVDYEQDTRYIHHIFDCEGL